MSKKEKSPGGANRQGFGGSFTRPDLAIPCQVASPQSLTPFHQAKQLYHIDTAINKQT